MGPAQRGAGEHCWVQAGDPRLEATGAEPAASGTQLKGGEPWPALKLGDAFEMPARATWNCAGARARLPAGLGQGSSGKAGDPQRYKQPLGFCGISWLFLTP